MFEFFYLYFLLTKVFQLPKAKLPFSKSTSSEKCSTIKMYRPLSQIFMEIREDEVQSYRQSHIFIFEIDRKTESKSPWEVH